MTQVFDVTYNPVATLCVDDDFLTAYAAASAASTRGGAAGRSSSSLAGSCTAYDLIVLGEIVGQCGRTRRGAALARAYLAERDA